MDTNTATHPPGKTKLIALRSARAVDDHGGDRSDDPAVSRAGIFCGFDFASDNLYAPPSTPGVDRSSPSPEANENFCAFANREAARRVAHEQKFSLRLVTEPVAENSNVIPFLREQSKPRHQIGRLVDRQKLAASNSGYEHSLSVAHTWQVIDGSGE